MSSHNPLSAKLAERLAARVRGEYPIPELHPKQAQFVESDAHHAAFIAGIGSGKSWAGCVRALRAAYGDVGGVAIRTPNLGIVTAPTYDMLRDATLRTFIELAGQRVTAFNKNEGVMRLANGSEIIWRSTQHPDRLRGPSVSWWFGDEAALYPAEVRRIMLGRLRQFGRQGYDWITTTPRGRNWVWQAYVRDGAGGDYAVVRATSRENVYLDTDVIQMWEREYTGDFARQELEGRFVAFEGLIYGEFDAGRHVLREVPGQPVRVVAGVDWGFANPGVILVCGVDGDGRMHVLAERYERRLRVEEWVDIALDLREAWGVNEWYADPSEPDYIRQMKEAGLKIERADNRVLPGIQRVKNRLVVAPDGRPRLTVAAEAVHLVAEFEQYQWSTGRDGLRDAPVKANDHAMDALRYAVMGVDENRRKSISVGTSAYA